MSFELLISERKIRQRLKKIGKQLQTDYAGEEVTIVMVMKGAICVVADLIRVVDFSVILECVSASSYGPGGTNRGELVITGIDAIQAEGKHILIVDDVFDTGDTLFRIVTEFKKKSPKSIKSFALLIKDRHRSIDYIPDYFLFKIGSPFVIGYGMDFKELYRGLPGIYVFQS